MPGIISNAEMPASSLHVISASRRTDLVAWFPDPLCDRLDVIGHERIHSLVIWTKDPCNMLEHARLRNTLRSLDQVFLLLSVTGMGGTEMEPGIPSAEAVLASLPDVVNLVGGPGRVQWRFDPILVWRRDGKRCSNLRMFERLAPRFSVSGITTAITSICSLYPKVLKRFRDHGRCEPVELSVSERAALRARMKEIAKKENFDLPWCCDPDEPAARCINGELLTRLHPRGIPAPTDPAAGQRERCGCTRSWDIGWYNQICRGGCLYCYASPAVSRRPL
jgi:hypothetical protein